MSTTPDQDLQARIAALEGRLEAQRSLLAELAADKGTLERALLQEQRRHVNLVERAPWIVARIDSELRYVDVNRFFRAAVADEDPLDARVGTLGESLEWVAVVQSFAEDKTQSTCEHEVEWLVNGESRRFVMNLSRNDIDGHISVLGTDQTERLLAISEAKAAAERADLANRAKSEFLAIMSHEIRTPLSGVLGMIELLSETALQDDQVELVETLRSSGTALHGLVNDVLDLNKIESGQIEFESVDFDPCAIVQSAIDLFTPVGSRAGLEISWSKGSWIPQTAIGDPLRLSQVLSNVLANAIKFTEKGSVRVLLTHTENDGAHRLQFTVADTGIGIDESRRKAVFEPFVQADVSTTRRFGGTGLGLVIARHLVEGMGGSIDLESELNRGTTVRFQVSVDVRATTAASREDAVQDATDWLQHQQPWILLAEDNAVNQYLARTMLERLGCRVTAVFHGGEAVEAVESPRASYDLVLMDVDMPVMDGNMATRKIRSMGGAFEELPIVAMTANAVTGARDECFEAGMSGWLGKPYTRQDLATVIAEQLMARERS